MAHFSRLPHLDELQKLEESEIRSGGYVIETIEAAVWCLITTDSLKDCLLKVVNLGHDTDTVAAVAGGLAGLYYSVDAIPKEWLKVINQKGHQLSIRSLDIGCMTIQLWKDYNRFCCSKSLNSH